MEPIQIEDLYRQRGQIHRLACALVGESDADDVVQEAMAAALARETPPRHWGRWLSGVTRNISWRRSSERRTQRRRLERHAEDEGWANAHESSPEELAREVEAKNALERAVLDLEEPYRSVLLWRFYEDLSIEEISRRSGAPPSTTRTRLARGLERLRARMETERGPEWRLALAPLLLRRPTETTLSGAAAGAGVTLMTISTLKWAAAASAAAAALAFLPGLLDASPVLERADGIEVRREVLDDVAVVEPETSTPAPKSRTSSAGPELEPRDAAVPAATMPSPRLVDAESGIALAGVEMKASVSITKGALFFKRNERLEATVVTDAEGRFEMPGDDGGKVVEGSHYGAIAAQHEGLLTVSCRATLDEGDGILLHPEVDFACRVRLATPLSADERAAASYGIAIADPDGNREGIRVRYRPAVALDDELLLLAPRYALRGDWDEGRTSGTITIATTPNGPTFAVTFDALPSLLDQPLLAEVSDTVIHTVRVVDAATGDAVPSAHVSVFPTGGRYAWLAPFTGGASDETGEAELIGVPQGECSVSIQKLGYVRKRSTLTAVAGGTTEVLLEPEAALRTVQIEVRSARGAGEPHVWIVVSRSDGMHAARAAVYAERDGDGWVARATLDTVPSERCFVELQGPSQAHDLQRHWILEADENELVIDVGPARDVQQVFIDAPEGVEFEYTQSIGPARRSVSEHVGPGIVRSAPVDGTPVSWTVRAEGYVPVVGTEADWTPAEVDGRAVVRLDAPFHRGWGEVVYVYSIGPADDGRGGELPFGMRAQVPAEGVTLLDGPEGRVIGVTNERGLAVIEGDERPAAIWYRHGGVIRKRRVLDGEESLHVLLR